MLDASLFLSPAEQAQAFLSALFAPTDLILCRPIEVWTDSATGKKESRTIHKQTRHVMAGMCSASLAHLEKVATSEKANLFFGVCPRVGSGGGFDLAWQIRTVRALWADVDGASPAEVLARCAAAKPPIPPPSIVVGSGNGAHLYWLLSSPYLITDGLAHPSAPAVVTEWSEEIRDGQAKKIPRRYFTHPATGQQADVGRGRMGPQLSPRAQHLQDVIQGLSAAIGGDHTHDLARILRLPGTLNRKDERNGRPAVMAKLLACDPGLRYPLERFAELAAASPLVQKREGAAKVPLPTPRSMTTSKRDKLNQLVAVSALAAPGTRSEKDFDLCCYAIKAAISPSEVWLLTSNVGKFAEKGRGYFDDTWRAAADEVRTKEYERLTWKVNGQVSVNGCGGNGSYSSSSLPYAVTYSPFPLQASTTPCGELDPKPADQAPAKANEFEARPVESDDDPHRLARVFLTRSPHPVLYWQGEFLKWNGRRYVRTPDHEIRGNLIACVKEEFDRLNIAAIESRIVENAKAMSVTVNLIASVLAALKSITQIPGDCEFGSMLKLDQRGMVESHHKRSLISLSNGLLDVEKLMVDVSKGVNHDHTLYLIPHTPLWFSLTSLPYEFNPQSKCETFLGMLHFGMQGDEQMLDLLQEWAGYLLLPTTDEQKFMMCEGEGGAGKSTFTAVMRAMLGSENVSTVELETFGERFALTPTLGCLLNVCADAPEIDRVAEGKLKAFTSGDPQTFDRKNREPLMLPPTARLMINCNTRPHVNDKSDGVWRRLLLVPWRVKVPEYMIIKGADKADFWSASGELPGIFAWALQGLMRLRQCGFTKPNVSSVEREAYKRESNPAMDFLLETYQACFDEQGFTTVAEMYQFYKSWCEANGFQKPLSSHKFSKEVLKVFPLTKEKTKIDVRNDLGEISRIWIWPRIRQSG